MQGHSDEILRERQVITPIKDVVVSCDECKKELLQFIVSDHKMPAKRGQLTEVKWKVRCSRCNSNSFIYRFSNKVYISPMEDTSIKDIKDDIIEVEY